MSLSPVNDEPKITRTAHAMLVPWGLFARQIGLIRRLQEVPIPQRKRDYEPHTKLIEFLAAILSGCRYLQDISLGRHPLDRDQTVADAWGQAAKLTAADSIASDLFGYSVSISGGKPVVGAPHNSTGAAYVYAEAPYTIYLPLVSRSYAAP